MPGMAALLSPPPARGQHTAETSERPATSAMRDLVLVAPPTMIISFVLIMYRKIGRKEKEA
jgi:hypothetical protein